MAALSCLGLGYVTGLGLPREAVANGHATRVSLFGEGAPAGFELIAFEAPGCRYCPVFRRDVAPTYAGSRAGRTAPLRFVDINDPAAGRLKLTSPVTMVPTLVLFRDGIEIGRIAGYVGRESLHRILAAMLPAE